MMICVPMMATAVVTVAGQRQHMRLSLAARVLFVFVTPPPLTNDALLSGSFCARTSATPHPPRAGLVCLVSGQDGPAWAAVLPVASMADIGPRARLQGWRRLETGWFRSDVHACVYTHTCRGRRARLECSCTARVYVLYAYYDDNVYYYIGERVEATGYACYALCVLCKSVCMCTGKCIWTPFAHTRTDWLSWKCSFGRPSMANRCESMTLRTHSTLPLPTRHTFNLHENA